MIGIVPSTKIKHRKDMKLKKEVEGNEKKTNIKIAAVLIFGAIVLLINGAISSKDSPSYTEAWAYMQIAVESKLKSPGSADFPFVKASDVVKHLGDNRYQVTSYVDATNSFGAEIRTYFDGVIRDEDKRWVLEDISFD